MDSEQNHASNNSSTGDDNTKITLQVGERRFTTLRDTLVGESDYFAARFSGRWNDADADGSYFVDADPTLFEHALRYLRSGNFPLFFDSASQTFDYAKYISLLGEARYFGIRKLENWIANKRYLDVVSLERSVTIIENANLEPLEGHLNKKANAKVEVAVSWNTQQVYVCPRGIYVHRGDRSRCGQACEKARERDGREEEYEEEFVPRAVITTTTVTFNTSNCLGS
ncbi:hypothetical protein F4776DRAFT_611441 [Hypoxylon sp. NC0597]|nr:hypothetical protein F4776DRAFT_611441 [Hypoxylon sp. NC0597]